MSGRRPVVNAAHLALGKFYARMHSRRRTPVSVLEAIRAAAPEDRRRIYEEALLRHADASEATKAAGVRR